MQGSTRKMNAHCSLKLNKQFGKLDRETRITPNRVPQVGRKTDGNPVCFVLPPLYFSVPPAAEVSRRVMWQMTQKKNPCRSSLPVPESWSESHFDSASIVVSHSCAGLRSREITCT